MILALDSSTESGCAALVDGDRVVCEVGFAGGRARTGGGAAAALAELADARIGRVIVGLGPGSYNGVRAAVAAAWGFARARGVPLHAASSLLALEPGEYLAAGDARQGHFYFAHIRDQEFVVEPMLVSMERLREKIGFHPELPVLVTGGRGFLADSGKAAIPNPGLLAGLAVGEPIPPEEIPAPVYLKPAHVTAPRQGGKIPGRPVSG